MTNRSSGRDAAPSGGPTRLRDLRNLGPASERMLLAAGIKKPEELDWRDLPPDRKSLLRNQVEHPAPTGGSAARGDVERR